MRIAFLGFGLIGGSVALALHAARPDVALVAWSPTGDGPTAALRHGVLADVAPTHEAAVAGADLVVVAAPPLAAVGLVRDLGAPPLRDALSPDATTTDVVSTKSRLVAAADAAGLPFVGGHPMAGREVTGYAAADAALFVGRPWVVVPGAAARPADIERVEWLAQTCGAEVVRMTADEHDAAVAAISHLPLALSAALVEAVTSAPDWPAARPLAANGWRDTTRLARGDVAMGTGIAATNAVALAARLRDVRAVIDAWLTDLEADAPDDAGIAAHLRTARDALDA
jgi:prephenate dehydrogenase